MSSAKKKNPVNRNSDIRQSYKGRVSKNLESYHIKYYLLLSGIIILTGILYSGSIHNSFIEGWDDDKYVAGNPDIMTLSIQSLKHICTRFYVNCYLPVTMLSYAIEHKLFGIYPISYHIDNIILHLLNIILVYIFVKLLLTNQPSLNNQQTSKNAARSTQYSALICSLLFAVHPMHVESVAWVAERKDLLYTFFYLASLIYYIKYINDKSDITQTNFKFQISNFYYYSLILFILSLLSKSMAVTLPIVLILIDYFKGKFEFNSTFRIKNLKLPEKLPFFILSVIFGIIALISQETNNDIDRNLLGINIIDRIFMLTYSFSFYIFKLIIPINLSAIHPFPLKSGGFLPFLFYISPLLIIGLLFLIWRIAKQKNSKFQILNFKTLIFGILFYIVTISIVLMALPVGHALVAERYSYVPYLGFFIIIAGISNYLKNQISKTKYLIFKLCFLFIILYFSYSTYTRIRVWNNGVMLFTDVIENHPDVSIAYNNRGGAIANAGNFTEALEDFNKAIALDPEYSTALNNRAVARTHTGDLKGAMEDYNRAIAIKPDYEDAYSNRGSLELQVKDYKGVIEDLNKVISLSPENVMAYNYRGVAKSDVGDLKGALEDYNKAITINPKYVDAYNKRGSLKGNLQDYQGALEDFNMAISLTPSDPLGYYNRGLTKGNMRDFRGALDDLNKVIDLNPNYALAFFNRGNLYFMLRQTSSACEDWNSALRLGLADAQNKISTYCTH